MATAIIESMVTDRFIGRSTVGMIRATGTGTTQVIGIGTVTISTSIARVTGIFIQKAIGTDTAAADLDVTIGNSHQARRELSHLAQHD